MVSTLLPKEVSDFLSTLLSASLAFEAVLLGVFGILYSVYAMYSAAATPQHPDRAPICGTLKLICRVLSAIMAFEALPTVYALYVLTPAQGIYEILAAVLMLSILVILGFALMLSFRLME